MIMRRTAPCPRPPAELCVCAEDDEEEDEEDDEEEDEEEVEPPLAVGPDPLNFQDPSILRS